MGDQEHPTLIQDYQAILLLIYRYYYTVFTLPFITHVLSNYGTVYHYIIIIILFIFLQFFYLKKYEN